MANFIEINRIGEQENPSLINITTIMGVGEVNGKALLHTKEGRVYVEESYEEIKALLIPAEEPAV